ncbi:MAG: nicotinate-nucleotide--dimethylbenzimidazole phosphoribosyltransferase [Firmicutes bacterium]|nr:nicotinate-nucleotide--dimethylbenzimidazole phosphoribosyltransferase [Bacillota bacterium]
METRLTSVLEHIKEHGILDEAAIAQAQSRQKVLAKPTGALGTLEDISIQLAGITGQVKNCVDKRAIVIMSADNGVVEEGVASAPQSVTLSQTINFTRRLTGVSSMAKHFGIDLLVVDIGVKLPIPEVLYTDSMVEDNRLTNKIYNKRLANGTKNLAKEPAMTREQALTAIYTGLDAAKAIKDCDYHIFGVGEMGIGNTTTSACILSALTGATGEEVVGRGGGLNDEGLAKKVRIVDEAVAKCKDDDIIDILAKVGGFDICAMVGAFLGAAYYRLPVVVDGYISAVAALAAVRLAPNVFNFLFGSHLSKEQGYKIAVDAMGIKPYFDLGMRLGEGSGCPISFNIIETACATMNEMATFEEGAIDADYLAEAEKGNFF